jgi:hypothetical protein
MKERPSTTDYLTWARSRPAMTSSGRINTQTVEVAAIARGPSLPPSSGFG